MVVGHSELVPIRKAGLRDVKTAQAVLAGSGVAAAILEPPGCHRSS